ncbi:hypothetical protein EVAR_66454_1 [Eumeta japonica]|uniref:Uncharacterized protein n=1 Tax=Eumeta variegata TaxID=151549 RepID=A0A4C1ZXD5_EUMVA|nr:hypothetical protein EVAR_66454_1 [Eumeta japonica]
MGLEPQGLHAGPLHVGGVPMTVVADAITMSDTDVLTRSLRNGAIFFLRRCPNAETLSRHESSGCGQRGGLRMRSNADTTNAT